MQAFKSYLKDKNAIGIYIILLIASILPALLAVKYIAISPDSMIYALISQEILSGNGLSLPIIYNLTDNYDFINGAVPYVGGPPLLPIFFALLGSVTPQNFWAAQAINMISHVGITIFTFLLMRKLHGNTVIALLTGILVSLSLPMLLNTHHMITESLYISLTVAAVFFMTLSRYSEQHQLGRNLFIASICTSAAVLTRFAGIALLPVFFWGIFVLAKNKNIKLQQASTIMATLLPLITTGALFIRTYIVSGSIHGIPLPSPDRSYLDAFTGTLKMTLLQFGLGERSILIVTIFTVFLILYIIINTPVRRKLLKHVHSGLDLILVLVVSHTAVITHAMAKSQTVFESRYMSPLTPFLFILLIIIVAAAWEMIRLKGFKRLALYGLILSLGLITFGNCYKTYQNSEVVFSKRTGHYRILNSHTYQWLEATYPEKVRITTNRPFHLSFFGDFSTIRLPHRRFNRNYKLPDNMESFLPEKMAEHGSKVLALFEDVNEEYEGNYLSKLFNQRENDENFILVFQSSDGVVYALKE